MSSALAKRKAWGKWPERINECWRKSATAIIETGKIISKAKEALEHGEFGAMIENGLPFSASTAQRLMAIAADPRLTKPAHVQHLPQAWGTLYELTKLDDDEFKARLKDGTIRPDMERSEVINGRTETRRVERLEQMRELAKNPLALPKGPFAAGIVDPPWEDPDSPIGFSDRHYRNKYPTMTPAQVAAMPVKAIFAPTAFLALWITRHILAIGSHVEVLKAWGFDPNTVVTWDKEWIGLGNGYVRDRTEHIVFATRGKPPVPGPKLRPDSLFAVRRSSKHSEKPDWMHERIEQWFPRMSYVELFGRGAPRKKWVTWGNESIDPKTGEVAASEPKSKGKGK